MLVFVLAACSKKEDVNYAEQQAAFDEAQIKSYINDNKIVATRDPSGVYYSVLTPGTGAYPTATSTVNVNYTGKFTDGTTFDSGNFTTVVNGNVIEGWKIGLQKINTNGRLLLMVPSALAYGPQGRGTIPANKVLVFTIDMLSIK
ncbi:FKBP-type peptidyl-prolyl cis-trans isomerase [Mucilaginibacter sp. PAMB04274]|uniref:FKBP-type peptidyl-prolyl cis-trans isomerase n=1 Tax=Mucilaginibacter sp. PAMB04274 TaxID=3138568 RepID=UPI0031F6FF9F